MQLSRYLDVCSVALSTAASNAVEVDASNCEGVIFVGVPGTTAARTWSMALKLGATTTGFVNCASTHTLTSSGAANQVIWTDVHKPGKRYVGGTFSSTTATPCYVLAIKYGLRATQTTFSATANLPAADYRAVVSPSSAT